MLPSAQAPRVEPIGLRLVPGTDRVVDQFLQGVQQGRVFRLDRSRAEAEGHPGGVQLQVRELEVLVPLFQGLDPPRDLPRTRPRQPRPVPGKELAEPF